MNDKASYFQIPTPTFQRALAIVPAPIDDEAFAAHLVDFSRYVFAHAEHLRVYQRTTPLSEAFLGAFVGLLEIVEMNSPEDATRCMARFREIVATPAPPEGPTPPAAKPAGPSPE
ncbi:MULTISPECIES: hypothetical protein [Burkholderia]|uniref:hypothetical protein n=1 Tax=Burkholderia TaxID=32008 RepID=UPI000D00C89D|nr:MULTISPECIES: hypothetical protein [Burkholderia]MBJ9679014.1 hypothetical protein [Burkholderia gladioli]MBU9170259.1 hypothetical protein [Burkholderia gladioli]MBU9180256.1 hypothetical protein [Burkholderia gladioli]MBU9276877.1 hypothetical protein [Burkholderia gladioli]MBU9323951.1 hypothetical protein [Burkholderia gladioli]